MTLMAKFRFVSEDVSSMNFGVIKYSILHFTFWLVGFSSAVLLMPHSSSREAYGVITGWWFACYMGYVLGVRFKASLYAFILYFGVSIASVLFGYQWLYKGHNGSINGHILLMLLIQSFVFISPILVNEVMLKITRSKLKGAK